MPEEWWARFALPTLRHRCCGHPLGTKLKRRDVYLEALHVAALTDLVAFVPRRLIAALSKQLSLATITPPLDPGIDEQYLFYPTRAQMDPGSIWLRHVMLEIGREMERTKTISAS